RPQKRISWLPTKGIRYMKLKSLGLSMCLMLRLLPSLLLLSNLVSARKEEYVMPPWIIRRYFSKLLLKNSQDKVEIGLKYPKWYIWFQSITGFIALTRLGKWDSRLILRRDTLECRAFSFT